MWMTNSRLLTLAAILVLVVIQLVWAALPQEATPVASTMRAFVPAESWDRPTLFELMDPQTGSDARPVVVRDQPAQTPEKPAD